MWWVQWRLIQKQDCMWHFKQRHSWITTSWLGLNIKKQTKAEQLELAWSKFKISENKYKFQQQYRKHEWKIKRRENWKSQWFNIRTPTLNITFLVVNTEKNTQYGKTCRKYHKSTRFVSMCHCKPWSLLKIRARERDNSSSLFLYGIMLDPNTVTSDWN